MSVEGAANILHLPNKGFRRIFGKANFPETVFAIDEWKYCALPYGSAFSEELFAAIAAAAGAAGDEYCYLQETDTFRDKPYFGKCPLEYEEFGRLLHEDEFLRVSPVALWGESERWGAFLYASDIGFFGGDESSMQSFVLGAGGLDELRSMNKEYFSPARGTWPDAIQKLLANSIA
jgi:hypothetical protein